MSENRRNSRILPFLGAASVGLLVGVFFGGPLLQRKDVNVGLFVIGISPLLGILVFGVSESQRIRQGQQPPEVHKAQAGGRRQRLILAGCALVLGPVLAGLFGALYAWLFVALPSDRWEDIRNFTILGTIAGGAVSLALGISAIFR